MFGVSSRVFGVHQPPMDELSRILLVKVVTSFNVPFVRIHKEESPLYKFVSGIIYRR